jgi:hypothetical protein
VRVGDLSALTVLSAGATSASLTVEGLTGSSSLPLSNNAFTANVLGVSEFVGRSRTYTVTVSASGRTSGTCTANLSVIAWQPATCTISSNPNLIELGQSTTLTINTSNAKNASLDGTALAVLTPNTVVKTPTSAGNITYTALVSNPTSNSSCSTVVQVVPACTPSFGQVSWTASDGVRTLEVSVTVRNAGSWTLEIHRVLNGEDRVKNFTQARTACGEERRLSVSHDTDGVGVWYAVLRNGEAELATSYYQN